MIKVSQRDGWILYLDDIRNPKDGRNWVIARTVEEAQEMVTENGCPKEVSLDHDLGEGLDGYAFVKWLVEKDLDDSIIPFDFKWNVHSANPVGAKNMDSMLSSYMNMKRKNEKSD